MELRPCGITLAYHSFWIYAVKANLHTYNVALIKRADYKTPTELWSSIKPNISHLRVFGCYTWAHILKKRRHKLDPKSRDMIFIGYEMGSKEYQFWDAAHHHIKISHNVKFNETLFPVQEATTSWASANDLPIFQSDNESDTSGLELVIPAQSPPRLPSPGLSALRPQRSPKQIHPHPPFAPPGVLLGMQPSGSGQPPAQPEIPKPQYSLHPTKERQAHQPQPSGDNINTILVNM